jgi:hypothetical protein
MGLDDEIVGVDGNVRDLDPRKFACARVRYACLARSRRHVGRILPDTTFRDSGNEPTQ